MLRPSLLVVLAAGCARGGPPGRSLPPALPASSLALLAGGQRVAELTPPEMVRIASPVEVSVYDPLYRKRKRYRALPLRPLLEAGFPATLRPLRDRDFVVRARDGFTVPIAGARLFEEGALLAFADLDAPSWEPVGETRASPAPLYLVWRGAGESDEVSHPRPYQIASIAVASVEESFPHAVPSGAPPGSAAERGFALFRARCIACHAVNREGGRVGPDLNVPRSIVEYRPAAQIRAYIRNPLEFRYGHMPANPDLGEADLDHLLAYFDHMRSHKHDPAAADADAHADGRPPH